MSGNWGRVENGGTLILADFSFFEKIILYILRSMCFHKELVPTYSNVQQRDFSHFLSVFLFRNFNCIKKVDNMRFTSNHLSVWSSAGLRIVTMLCNHSPELLHFATLKLYTHQTTPTSTLAQALTTTFLLAVSVGLTTLGTSYRWNHRVFVFLWPAYLPWHKFLKVHSCCSICQNFFYKAEWHSIVCVDHTLLFIHLSLDTPSFGYCEQCCYERGNANMCLRSYFQFL